MGYTFLDLAEEVLAEKGEAMTIRQIWDYSIAKGYNKKLLSIGKTPEKTLNAQLHRNIELAKNVRFKQISKKPALFDLIM